jgi:hypothetical protein
MCTGDCSHITPAAEDCAAIAEIHDLIFVARFAATTDIKQCAPLPCALLDLGYHCHSTNQIASSIHVTSKTAEFVARRHFDNTPSRGASTIPTTAAPSCSHNGAYSKVRRIINVQANNTLLCVHLD